MVAIAILTVAFFSFTQSAEAIHGWVDQAGPLGWVIFPAAYILCNLLLLPGGILAVAAGYLWGLFPGFGLVLFGNVAAAAVAYLLGRRLLRRRVERFLLRHPRFARMDALVAAEGRRIVFLTQLSPLAPSSLLNYLYGATGLSFWRVVSGVLAAQIPGLFLYAYLGSLGQMSLDGLKNPFIWGAGLVLTVTGVVYLSILAQRILQEKMDPEILPERPSERERTTVAKA